MNCEGGVLHSPASLQPAPPPVLETPPLHFKTTPTSINWPAGVAGAQPNLSPTPPFPLRPRLLEVWALSIGWPAGRASALPSSFRRLPSKRPCPPKPRPFGVPPRPLGGRQEAPHRSALAGRPNGLRLTAGVGGARERCGGGEATTAAGWAGGECRVREERWRRCGLLGGGWGSGAGRPQGARFGSGALTGHHPACSGQVFLVAMETSRLLGPRAWPWGAGPEGQPRERGRPSLRVPGCLLLPPPPATLVPWPSNPEDPRALVSLVFPLEGVWQRGRRGGPHPPSSVGVTPPIPPTARPGFPVRTAAS